MTLIQALITRFGTLKMSKKIFSLLVVAISRSIRISNAEIGTPVNWVKHSKDLPRCSSRIVASLVFDFMPVKGI